MGLSDAELFCGTDRACYDQGASELMTIKRFTDEKLGATGHCNGAPPLRDVNCVTSA